MIFVDRHRDGPLVLTDELESVAILCLQPPRHYDEHSILEGGRQRGGHSHKGTGMDAMGSV